MLAAGCDVNASGSDMDFPLCAAARGGHYNCVWLLLESGGCARINELGSSLRTPLHEAVLHGCYACVGLLLERGANPLISRSHVDSPIEIARRREDVRMLKMLERA